MGNNEINNNAIFVGGNTGESIVNDILLQTNLRFYRNIYLKDNNDNICQIDFLLVTNTSIVVLEVKNYTKCVIKGDEEVQHWTACYMNRKKTFYNPIMQNKSHIDILRRCLNNDSIPIFNYVVFTSSCSVRVDKNLSDRIRVINVSDLWYDLIDSIYTCNELSKNTVNKTIDILNGFNDNSFELSEEHMNKYFNNK